MRVGIVHPALGTGDLQEAFALAAEAGAEGIEVCYASAAIATVLGRPEHAQQLAEAAGRTGVAIPSLHLGCFRAEPALIGRQEVIESTSRCSSARWVRRPRPARRWSPCRSSERTP